MRAQILVRVRDDRVFFTSPGPREPGSQRADPASWQAAPGAGQLACTDDRYGTVTVSAWGGVHPKLAHRGHWAGMDIVPIVPGAVIRVHVHHLPKPTTRAKKTLWLWWSGPAGTVVPDLDTCWRAYITGSTSSTPSAT